MVCNLLTNVGKTVPLYLSFHQNYSITFPDLINNKFCCKNDLLFHEQKLKGTYFVKDKKNRISLYSKKQIEKKTFTYVPVYLVPNLLRYY